MGPGVEAVGLGALYIFDEEAHVVGLGYGERVVSFGL